MLISCEKRVNRAQGAETDWTIQRVFVASMTFDISSQKFARNTHHHD
jgi:hypothetical protein